MEISNIIEEFYRALTSTNNPIGAGVNRNNITRGTSSLDYQVGNIQVTLQFLSSSKYSIVIGVRENGKERNSEARTMDLPYLERKPDTNAVIAQNIAMAKAFLSSSRQQ